MDLDRGTLAKIDRKISSGLGHDVRYQMVRVPVSEAAWSTWKRYCDAVGISMGRAIAALVEHELCSVFGESNGQPRFLADLERNVTEHQADLDARERRVVAREEWLRQSERRRSTDPIPTPTGANVPKVGRNDPCTCGSGLKYKRCHGS